MLKNLTKLSSISKLFTTPTSRFQFCFKKITQKEYSQLSEQFQKNPTQQIFQQYRSPTNLIEIYTLVKQTGMSIPQKIKNYSFIQQLCLQNDPNANEEMQFNVLANVYVDKSKLSLQQGNITEAILQIQKAVETIQNMENPHYVEVAMICQSAGNLHLQVHSFQKALKYFEDSQNFMKIGIEEMQEVVQQEHMSKQQKAQGQLAVRLFFAKLYTEFGLLYLQTGKLKKSEEYLNKSISNWEKIPIHNILSFLTTVKYQCILKLRMKNEKKSIEIAQNYLRDYHPNKQTAIHRLWFMKFLAERGLDQYRQQLKQNLESLSKNIPEKQLQDLLIRIGVISSQKNPNNEKDK